MDDLYKDKPESIVSINDLEKDLIEKRSNSQVTANNEQVTIDDFLDTIGLSKYHYFFFAAVALIMMHEGSQLVIVSIVNVIYSDDPTQNQTLISLFGSSLFIGNLIGSLGGGWFSDSFGRKIPLGCTMGLMYVSALLQFFFDNLGLLIFLRTMYGVGMGVFGAISFPYLAEIMPRKYRGLFLTLFGGVWTIGGILTALVALALNPTLKKVDWQMLTLIVNQTALISIVIVFFYAVESPRFSLLVKKDFPAARKQLQGMAKKAGKSKSRSLMNDSNYENLEQWAEEYNAENQKPGTYLDLFKSDYLRRTLAFMAAMFLLSFNYYGAVYITPKVYEQENSDSETISLLYPNFSELIAGIGAALCIELSFFGRKKSVYLGSILGALASAGTCVLLSMNNTDTFFWIFSSGTRFFADFALIILEAFISESYGTRVRGMGIGMALSAGRVASSFMPFILNFLLDLTQYLPFLLIGGLNILTVFSIYFAPKETRGEKLED